ncbi:MAG TPA: FkbM family methyltransferase [Phototrophicaceae bacterium]|nr:FkbM family methyltransferase [Phototrophicaceae bacterium]
MPSLDKYLLILPKVFYLMIRILFRVILGKGKRNRSRLFQKLYYYVSISPSFLLMMYLHKIKKSFGMGSKELIIIKVPKYNYKSYCPPNKDDFLNMTIREEDILKHFCPKDGDTVVDVGAHIGRYTMISSNCVGKDGKVIAIEANPRVFEALKRNIKLNDFDNVLVLNYAVFSKQTKIKLFLPPEEENHTIYNTIMSDRATDEKKFVEVNANTLDAILQSRGISEVNWIKIDVEGAELEVLKGSADVLSKSKDISILIEIHDLGNGKNLYEPIMDLLKNHDYKMEFEKTYDSGEKHIVLSKRQH